MKNLSIFEKSWVDLVFEHKNKDYGAYQLRLENSKTMVYALFLATAMLVFALSLPKFLSFFDRASTLVAVHDHPTLVLVDLRHIAAPRLEKKPVLPQKKVAVAAVVGTMKVAQKDDLVEEVPTNKEQTAAVNVAPTGSGGGIVDGVVTAAVIPVMNTEVFKPFELDKNPEFPGGLNAFLQFVGTNFNSPDEELDQTLKIYVSFVVEVDGTMTHIEVKRDPGFGLAAEAIRVLKSIKTKWEPGRKDGVAVRAFYNLPISVVLK